MIRSGHDWTVVTGANLWPHWIIIVTDSIFTGIQLWHYQSLWTVVVSMFKVSRPSHHYNGHPYTWKMAFYIVTGLWVSGGAKEYTSNKSYSGRYPVLICRIRHYCGIYCLEPLAVQTQWQPYLTFTNTLGWWDLQRGSYVQWYLIFHSRLKSGEQWGATEY